MRRPTTMTTALCFGFILPGEVLPMTEAACRLAWHKPRRLAWLTGTPDTMPQMADRLHPNTASEVGPS
jgi:hypothetical protein